MDAAFLALPISCIIPHIQTHRNSPESSRQHHSSQRPPTCFLSLSPNSSQPLHPRFPAFPKSPFASAHQQQSTLPPSTKSTRAHPLDQRSPSWNIPDSSILIPASHWSIPLLQLSHWSHQSHRHARASYYPGTRRERPKPLAAEFYSVASLHVKPSSPTLVPRRAPSVDQSCPRRRQ